MVCLAFAWSGTLFAQGNKLSIQATTPKNLTVCGLTDTARVTVFNISSSVITGVTVTLNLPSGVRYISGSVNGAGIAESNITNLNRPVFSAPNLLIARNFTFRYRVSADCDIIPLLSGNNTPIVNVRADYSGNYDAGASNPFVPALPSPGYNTITNQSFTGNVGDKFVRRITITNYGKGPLSSVRLVRIKGKDLSLRSETGFGHRYNGDSVISTFDKALFTTIGDKDSSFEQNESISFSDTFTINGCNSLNTQYELAWGCNGKLCQLLKNNALVTISSQSPNLQVSVSSTLVHVYDGTQASKMTMRIVNAGQMKAGRVAALIFQTLNPAGGFTSGLLSRIDSSSIRIRRGWNGSAQRAYTDTFLSNVATPCWNAGSMGGFRLKPADLQPKDTIWITWDVYRCANTTCNAGFYELGWGYRVSYRNQCNTVLTTNDQWGSVYTYSGGGVSLWAPTDVMPGDVKDFRYLFSGMGNVPLDANARIRIDLILPVTLSHSLRTADFYIDNANLTAVWYPDSIKMVRDTLRAFFGRAFRFGLSNGELTVRLKGICSGTTANQLLPVRMNFWYNPNATAHPGLWIKPICHTVNVKVHCSNFCRGGMQFRNFEVFRSSFGRPDNNNDGLPDASGRLDSLRIRTERIMFGDTLTTVFVGRPRPASGTNNWPNGYAESFVTYGDYLNVVDVRLQSIKAGRIVTGTCNRVKWRKVSSGANATFYFDFSVDSIWSGGCLTRTYRYTQNDSMRLIVRYRVSKNLGGNAVSMNFSNRYYLSTVANPSVSQSFQCDTFSGSCILYGYYFHNFGPDLINYSNCAETWISQNFYLGIGRCCSNYGGANVFPFEYRNWARPVAMRMFLPSGLKLNRTRFGQYRTSGSNATAHEMKDTVPARRGSTNPFVFDFTKYFKDSGGNVNYSDDGFHGYFQYSVIPSCSLPAGVRQNIVYEYIYERRGAMGKGYDTIRSPAMGTNDVFVFQPPTLTLQPALATVYATSDTAEWEVRYTNPSTGFNAFNIWLSPGRNPNIRVVEVRDAVRDTVIKPVNDIYRAGTLSPNSTRRFKVRAVYTSCNPDSLWMYASWNCAGYPADFASYPCTPNRTTLFLEPQNTRLQVTLTDSASTLDLCAGNKISLLIENIQAVTAYQNRVRVTLPIGMEIISGTGKAVYPLKASASSLTNPSLVSGTTWEWDLSKLLSALSKGLSGTSDTTRNKLLLTFRVKTNCDYASGSFISARVLSNIKCGDPVPANPAFSNPLEIKGVVRPYYTLVKTWADSVLPCQKPTNAKVRVVFLGPNKSGGNDMVEVMLPPGMAWDSTYWKAIRNAPARDSVKISNFSGTSLISWKMPPGIQPGDSMEFDIRISAAGSRLVCGPSDVLVRSVVSQSVICVSTGKPCDIKVITGSILANPPVDKGNLQIQTPSMSARILTADTEQLTIRYRLRNTGRYMSSAADVVVRYHYDANGDGKWGSGDPYIGADTIRKALPKDSFVNVVRVLKVKAGQSCGMIALVDSGACACKFGQTRFAPPRLFNAGRDTAICAGAVWRPGMLSVRGFRYQWDRTDLLDNVQLASPMFTGTGAGTSADTQWLELTTFRGACQSKDSVKVIVYPLPRISVSRPDPEICYGQSVSVSPVVNSGTAPYRWSWSPGAGLSDSLIRTPMAKPAQNTKYNIRVTDAFGCAVADTLRITVYPNPVVYFTWPVTCQGADPLITDSSLISSGNIVNRQWSTPWFDTFGVSQIALPMGGRRTAPVSLIAVSEKGCADSVVRMVDVKRVPSAAFDVAYVCEQDSSRFVNRTSQDSIRISAWSWDFGDGNNASGISPVHLYASSGDRPVTLVAVSDYGCRDTAVSTARVFPNPSSRFTVSEVCAGDTLRLINSSSLNGDTLLGRFWERAGNLIDTALNPSLFIPAWGAYPVRLINVSVHGCRDTFTDTAFVRPLPVVSFSSNDTCLGFPQRFRPSVSIPAGVIRTYNWKFGDGNSSSQTSPWHTYASEGAKPVTLILTSDRGCKDSAATTVKVHPPVWPVIRPADHCLRQTLSLTAQTRGNGIPVKYLWYTGDGDSLAATSLNHTYRLPGTFNLRLKITTDLGCIRDTLVPVSVFPLPQVGFSAVNPCNDDSLVFTDRSSIATGSMNAPVWRFTTGTSATGTPVIRKFAVPGTYSANLYRTSDKGCTDSASSLFRVWPAVSVNYTADPVCEEETSLFTDLSVSTVPVSARRWTFGDGAASTDIQPTRKYRLPGTYNTTLTITTLPGCQYSTVRPAVVHPKPKALFTTSPDQGTILDPLITITDASMLADSLRYVLSNGYTTRQRSFSHAFPDSGSFNIRQYAVTRFGCRDSFDKDIYIHFMYTLHVPTAFTPNTDGKNEQFGPVGMGIRWYSMKIFDRWGQMLYDNRDSRPWDGKYRGEYLPEGVYVVLIEIKDYKGRNHYYKGTVHLLR